MAGILTGAAALTSVGGASAAGPAVQVGQPFSNQPPSIAVDSAGNALIAWDDNKDLANSPDFVQYCLIPVGATTCSQSGNLSLGGGNRYIDGVQALVDGGTYAILADAYGGGQSDEPLEEWQSLDGATWNLLDGGKSVSSGHSGGDTGPLNGLIVPGTNLLGFGWTRPGGDPTFNAFPLNSPPECSLQNPCPFANLEPASNPDAIANVQGVIAGQAGASPGVLAVYPTLFNDGGPFSCPNSTPDGLAFAYGSGNQSATNSYNVDPGSANSAWRVPATQGECGVQRFTVAGGPSGFGILGDNEANGTTFYQRFDQTNITFNDTPKVTVSPQGDLYPSLGQDGGGGVYATYLNDGAGGPIALSYSYDGDTTWSGPNVLRADPGVDHPASAVNGAGQGWVTWTNGGSVYAEPFTALDSVPPPQATTLTTSQTAGTATGSSITVPAGTTGETDRAAIHGANAAAASGTVTYSLFSSASCAAPSQVFTSTVAVSGGSVPASAPVTSALGAGTYYWVASYSGNAGNDHGAVGNVASASGCGGETLTIGAAAATSNGGGQAQLGGSGTSSGTTITITVTCTSPPCTITITITDPTAQQATAARKKGGKGNARKKTKPALLARITLTLHQRGAQKVTLRLTGAGKRYFATHHGTVSVHAALTSGHRTVTKTIRVRVGAARKGGKHTKK